MEKTYRIHIRIILSTKARSKKKKHQLSSYKTVIQRTRKNRLRLNLTPINTSPLCLILPQALNRPKAKNNETDDHVLDAFKKVTITIPLIDAIKHIPSYAKFLKGICTPHRNHRRIQLSETVSYIMMNSLPIKKRDPGAPMIMSEIGGMSFTRFLLDTGASINILPKAVFGRHHVGELQTFLVELCLADRSVRKPHGLVEDVIVRIEDCYFGRFPSRRYKND